MTAGGGGGDVAISVENGDRCRAALASEIRGIQLLQDEQRPKERTGNVSYVSIE